MGFHPPRDVSQRSHNFLFSQGNFHPDKQFSEIVRARFEKSSFLNEMISLNSHNWRVIKKNKTILVVWPILAPSSRRRLFGYENFYFYKVYNTKSILAAYQSSGYLPCFCWMELNASQSLDKSE